jgi:acetyl-CoA acyltransferase
VIHAGNASQICDGAAAMMIASPAKARALGLKPRARIRAMALAGVDPTLMLHGVMPVTEKVLKKAGLTLADIDLFEVNEAFACVPLAWMQDLGVPHEKLNVNGGAIALGHPLGASGVRIATTLLHEMERRDVTLGLATMCIGFGMAIATIFERI